MDSPADVLYAGAGNPLPALACCEHYAGSEKLISKALSLQAEMAQSAGQRSSFDVTADCEDGAAAGDELNHAQMIAELLNSPANSCKRMGVRIHDIKHPRWQDELDILIRNAGENIAYVVLPKVGSQKDAQIQSSALQAKCNQYQIKKKIPLHVLIETPNALHEAWQIAMLPGLESLDFGLLDFISAQHGAIAASNMVSPGQFDNPVLRQAKVSIVSAALGNHIVPAHNITTEFRDLSVVSKDASRARQEFGFLRMWSIHPAQIRPIVEAMQPSYDDVENAGGILTSAQEANWGPIQISGKLHDRASYRYYWDLLRRAHASGMELPAELHSRFFTEA